MTSNNVELDRSPEAIQRRQAEVTRRLSSLPTTTPTASRDAARRKITAEVEAEEIAAAKTEATRAEAAAERARILSVVKVGLDLDRPRQALRLAILGPVSADQAKSILPSLTPDRDALDTALIIGTPGTFGSTAAQDERRRIAAVFAAPEARDRFATACALALEGGEAIPVSAITSLLANLPQEAAAPTHESIEQRAEGLAEFGDGGGDGMPPSRAERSAEGWRKAAAAANAMIGATGPAPAPHGQTGVGAALSSDHPDHPDFGTTAAMEAALAARGR